MLKNVWKINRTRLQRSFVGQYDARSNVLRWIECGHYYQGVEIAAEEIYEKNGFARNVSPNDVSYESLGYMVTGTGEPAQNDREGMQFITQVMRGTQGFAGLIGDKLVIFGFQPRGAKPPLDCRVSFKAGTIYSAKLKGKFEIEGYVPGFEIHFVNPKSVVVQNGRLVYTETDTAIYLQ